MKIGAIARGALGGIGVVIDDPGSKAVASQQTAVTHPTPQPLVAHAAGAASDAGGPIDPKYTEHLQQAVDAATPDAYRLFLKMLEALRALPEELRYPNALSAVEAAHGIKPADITAALEARRKAIETAQHEFDIELQGEVKNTVGTLDASVAGLAQQIAEAETSLADLRQRKTSAEQEAAARRKKFDDGRVMFQRAAEAILAQLASEASNVTKHIGTG